MWVWKPELADLGERGLSICPIISLIPYFREKNLINHFFLYWRSFIFGLYKETKHLQALNENLIDSSLLVDSSQGIPKTHQSGNLLKSTGHSSLGLSSEDKVSIPQMPGMQFITNPIIVSLTWIPQMSVILYVQMTTTEPSYLLFMFRA